MHNYDIKRVEFYSVNDFASSYNLSKAEPILKNEIKSEYEDINDVMELYNIKKYIDNELFLKIWTDEDISNFKKRIAQYGKIIGQFMSKINDSNILPFFEQLLRGYIYSFWELVNNQNIYKQISSENLINILTKEPHEIRNVLTQNNLVVHFNIALCDFLINYPRSAEILLPIYEVKQDISKKEMFLPKNLTIQNKEDIISKYLDSDSTNSNYFQLIQNARNTSNFKIPNKIRLKAKQRYKEETDKLFKENNNSSFKFAVSIRFPKNMDKIKHVEINNFECDYSYSYDYIKQNSDNYSLFINFRLLFEYLDEQGRINLVSKKNNLGVLESIIGIHSQNEYRIGISFHLSEASSHAQIFYYCMIINDFGNTIENILQINFTSIFQDNFNFCHNARISIPSVNTSYLEKVRFLAPEFESVIKQYKLFVEENNIDTELLEIASLPCTIKEIPSLMSNKYLYLNENNQEIVACSNLFFSNQTTLAFVEPFKDKHYHCLFDLLLEEMVNYNDYEEHQKHEINYLIKKRFLVIDKNNFIQIINYTRVLILKDLYENEVASFYYYPPLFQNEAKEMENQSIIFFESSLFSKPEQSYFNYYLNKSEFTNGLDLRNSYLHGTQSNPNEIQKHENAYFTYLKLLVLVLLKIEDDLYISQTIKKINE